MSSPLLLSPCRRRWRFLPLCPPLVPFAFWQPVRRRLVGPRLALGLAARPPPSSPWPAARSPAGSHPPWHRPLLTVRTTPLTRPSACQPNPRPPSACRKQLAILARFWSCAMVIQKLDEGEDKRCVWFSKLKNN